MKSYKHLKTESWVQFIIASIFLAAGSFVYLRFYRILPARDWDSVVYGIKESTTMFTTFMIFSIAWFVLTVLSMASMSRCSKIYGGSFGAVLLFLFVLAEYAGYVLAITFLFVP